MSNSVKIHDRQEVGDKFNSYFSSIGEHLASNIPDSTTDFFSYLSPSVMKSFVLGYFHVILRKL